MAPLSSILAWKIPSTESLVGYSPWGHKELDMTEHTHTHMHILCNIMYLNSLWYLREKQNSVLVENFQRRGNI